MNDESLIYHNKFVNTLDTKDLPPEKVDEYQLYREQKIKELEKQKIIVGNTGKPYSQNYLFDKKSNDFKGTAMGESSSFITDRGATFRSYESQKVIAIDSKHRDLYAFPDANNFTWEFEEEYTNVNKIELISTEIPNTDQTIKDAPLELANNVMSWINYEDADLNIFTGVTINTVVADTIDIFVTNSFTMGTTVNILVFNSKLDSDSVTSGFMDNKYSATVVSGTSLRVEFTGGTSTQGTCSVDLGYPVYTVSFTPGNYNATTLIAQMTKTLNLVKRRNGTGKFHYYNISLNLDTNIITLESVITSSLSSNPISTTINSTIVTVYSLNHGFKTGDTVLMIGVAGIAGIPSGVLNGNYVVDVVDFNTFTYEVNVSASSTSTGGGNNIKTGKQAPYRILFKTAQTKIQYNIGFNNEDSSEYIGAVDPITTKCLSISNIVSTTVPGNPVLNESIDVLRITTTVPHGLYSCKTLYISDISVTVNGCVTVTTKTPHLIGLPTVVTVTASNSSPNINGDLIAFPSGPYTFYTTSRDVYSVGNIGTVIYGGDRVKLQNVNVSPSLKDIPDFYILNTSNANQIDVKYRATATPSTTELLLADATVRTSQITVTHPGHGFNQLVEIAQITQDKTSIKTLLNTNLIGTIESNVAVSSGPTGTNTVDIVLTNHGLMTSDSITIQNSNTNPIVDGIYNVQVISENEFRINFVNSGIASGTCTVVYGATISITDSDSLPRIDGTYNTRNRVVVDSVSTGTNNVVVTTVSPNYWIAGDTIVLSLTNSTPSTDGTFVIQTVVDIYTFVVDVPFPIVSPGTNGVAINTSRIEISTQPILASGTKGNLQRDNSVTLYRVASDTLNGDTIGGLKLSSINGIPFPILEIVDTDTYTLRIPSSYATRTVNSGGTGVYTSSFVSGWRSQQANTTTGDANGSILARAINLAGEPYILLVSPTLNGNSTFKVSGKVKDVLGKILLKDSPSYMNYDGYITSPTIFNPPLSKLNNMNFQLVNSDGYSYNLVGLDYSFSLRVTQEHVQLLNTYENTRTN